MLEDIELEEYSIDYARSHAEPTVACPGLHLLGAFLKHKVVSVSVLFLLLTVVLEQSPYAIQPIHT